MKMFYHRSLRSTRLHRQQHRFQTLRRFHLWQSVGDLAHFILKNPASKRWRPDTLHPETPVPTTTHPQLRWRAGVLRALRPFRRLRDTKSAPSERVKRSRLAPAQVMTTTVAKHGDWSLDFDERGSVFDGAQDWRQGKKSILLPNLQRISVCCLRPWNVNGRNGRSTRQHHR